VELGLGPDVVGNLADVGQQARALLAVEVLGDGVHVVGAVLEQAGAPGAGVAGGNAEDGGIDFAHLVHDPVLLEDVLLEGHEAELPRAPHFVADAPVLHAERLGAPFLARRAPQSVSVEPLQYSSWAAAE
jgi:hypothetical protein